MGKKVTVDALEAFFASAALHCLLLFVLSAPSTYLPVTGDVARFQVLWFSAETVPSPAACATPVLPVPAFGPEPQGEDAAPDDQSAVAFGAAAPVGFGAQVASGTVGDTATRGDGAPAGDPPKAEPSENLEPRQVRSVAFLKGGGPAAGKQADLEGPVPVRSPATPALSRPTQGPVTPPYPQAAPKLPRDTAGGAVSQGTSPPLPGPEPATAPKTTESTAPPRAVADPPQSQEGDHSVAASPRMRPTPDRPEPKGMVFPVVRGDLALVVVGAAEIKLGVFFRAYPRSRRTREVTKAEGRRQYRLTPVVVKTGEMQRRAVIEKASEGVYTFVAEGEVAHPSEAEFIVEVGGAPGSKTVKALGSCVVAGRRVIAKVLMPEGLFWDDASAFTGSMVDAESTTKFNASTGLLWKEYDP